MSHLCLAVATLMVLALHGPANAQSVNVRAAATKESCTALMQSSVLGLAEAPTQILSARVVEATDGVAAHCDVRGVIYPNVGYQIQLPMSGWNGRFFSVGCGNYCGKIEPTVCNDPLSRGYACIANDSGHVARPEDVERTDGQWAMDNLQAELDWGGRASHVSAVAGKAITELFYKQAPAKSYFMGCSYGGHQAMVLAQRFPWDFDGIVGGGVPNSISALMQQNSWALSKAWTTDLKSVFSDKDISVLHAAALAKCDMDDSVKDGLVSNPQACHVDVDALICKAGATADCVSREIATVAKQMYAGPSDSQGRRVSPGGWEPGTELYWQKVYRPDGTGLAALAENYFRFMGRIPEVTPGWKPRDYDFDRDYKRNDVMETLYAAASPDLRRFKANGGKFINFVGQADLGTIPAAAIDYYETTQRTMGGRAATTEFFRMFLIEDALHCRGGGGPWKVDFIRYIEDWVERNQAPDVMIGVHPDDKGVTAFSRPLYPYPNLMRYKGSGDPNDAASFRQVVVP